MLMTKKKAYEILELPEGASKEEVKRVYTTIALTTHPDQKSSTDETTQEFKNVSLAYKRLQQDDEDDWVHMSSIMEQFSSIFRFRMKTDNGYVYFMYNPYTGLPDSDDDEFFAGEKDHHYKRCHKKLEYNSKWNEEKKIVEIDPKIFQEMQDRANKNAEELINEEDKAKKKAKKRKEKKLRQREKKKLSKESTDLYESEDNSNQDNVLKILKEHNEKLSNNNNFESSISKTKLTQNSKSSRDSQSLRNKDETKRSSKTKAVHVQNPKNINKKFKKKVIPSYPEHKEDSGSEKDSDDPSWDEESAFFSKALKHSKTKLKSANKISSQQTNGSPLNNSTASPKLPKSQDIITISRQFAVQGNQLAGTGEYRDAAQLFTKAISLLSTDYRYFGNRSFCYDRLEEYQSALEDADTAIRLSGVWAKGYFRKGRALAGLKRYVEAEQAFEKVLKLDKQCTDAEQELHSVRIKHLKDMGFKRELCEVALRKKVSIQLALDELLSGVLSKTELKDVYVSDDDDDAQFFQKEIKKPKSPKKDDTFSEVDYNSLWIGNLTSRVSENALETYFSQFGAIKSVTAMYVRRCAFVNFMSTESAKLALLARDTIELNETLLVIRYPDRAFNQSSNRVEYKNKRECLYWRNRGCHFGSACRYLHVEANKGIDLQTVERTPYQSIAKY